VSRKIEDSVSWVSSVKLVFKLIERTNSELTLSGDTNELVDGVGPTNMSVDLPSNKSQLYLRPFGVGVSTMCHTVSP